MPSEGMTAARSTALKELPHGKPTTQEHSYRLLFRGYLCTIFTCLFIVKYFLIKIYLFPYCINSPWQFKYRVKEDPPNY